MSGFTENEAEIRRHWRADRPFDALNDGFDRLSALAMLDEIDRLRARVAGAHSPGAAAVTDRSAER